MFFKNCQSDDFHDPQETQKKLQDYLTIENAVLMEFDSHVRRMLGRVFMRLPFKAKAMVNDIQEIRKMIWLLLNADCVQFYVVLADLRTAEFHMDTFSSFSIFKYTDDETHALIQRLARLAKDRIFQIKPKDKQE